MSTSDFPDLSDRLGSTGLSGPPGSGFLVDVSGLPVGEATAAAAPDRDCTGQAGRDRDRKPERGDPLSSSHPLTPRGWAGGFRSRNEGDQ
jgi:hypothetical protein